MFILSDYLEVITWLTPSPKRVQQVVFNEQKNTLVLSGKRSVTLAVLECQNLYQTEKTVLLDPIDNQLQFSMQIVTKLKLDNWWIKQVKADQNFKILVIWGANQVQVFDLELRQTILKTEKVCTDSSIVDCLCNTYHDYLIVGGFDGYIYLYNVFQLGKQIHIFKGHSRSIIQLQYCKNNDFFLSASYDNTLRMWNLNEFSQIYQFYLPIEHASPLNFLCFPQTDQIAYCQSTNICIGRLNLIGKFVACLQQEVVRLIWINSNIGILTSDNTITVISEKGDIQCTIFPPPTPSDMKQIEYLQQIDKILILLQNGQICLFDYQDITGKLFCTVNSQQIRDREHRSLRSKIQQLKLINFKPPKFDNQLNFTLLEEKEVKDDGEFIAIVAGKGTLVFLNSSDLTYIYARISPHREPIIDFQEITEGVITICQEYYMVISKIQGNEFVVLQQLILDKCFRSIGNLIGNSIFIGWKGGEIDYFDVNEDGLFKRFTNQQNEHDSQVIFFDVDQHNNRLCTASQDGRVKVWNFQKQLIKEFIISEEIKGLLFTKNGQNIIIAQKQTLTKYELWCKPQKLIDFNLQKIEKVCQPNQSFIPSPKAETFITSTKQPKIREEASIVPKRPSLHIPKKQFVRRSYSNTRSSRPASPFTLELQQTYKQLLSKRLPSISPSIPPPPQQKRYTRRQMTEQNIIYNLQNYGDVIRENNLVLSEDLYFLPRLTNRKR